MTPFYRLSLGLLVTWRITHLLAEEDGPWDLFVRFRRLVGQGFWGQMLDCFHCLSLWVALPLGLLLGTTWEERLLLVPALSGGAILLERLLTRGPGQATYFEDEEATDAVLRGKTQTAPREPDQPPGA